MPKNNGPKTIPRQVVFWNGTHVGSSHASRRVVPWDGGLVQASTAIAARSVCGGCGERVVIKDGHWCVDCLLDTPKHAAYLASRDAMRHDIQGVDRSMPKDALDRLLKSLTGR